MNSSIVRILAILISFLGFACATPASAQINVDYYNGTSWINIGQYFAGSNVSIINAGSTPFRVYTQTPSTQSIGNISIAASSGATPTLFVGQGFTETSETSPLPTAGALNVGGITYSGGQPSLQILVNGDVTGDINFWHIVRLDVGGYLIGNVTHDPAGSGASPPRLGVISAHDVGDSLTSPNTITATAGDILQVSATRILYSNIHCQQGSIVTIEAGPDDGTPAFGYVSSPEIFALNGSIGSITATGFIATGGNTPSFQLPVSIKAKNGITLVQAYDDLRANVIANANDGDGDITRLECLQQGGSANFTGSLTARTALGDVTHSAIRTIGDCDADVMLSTSFSQAMSIGGALPLGRTISVGGSLVSGASISVGLNTGNNVCIAGQVIINANSDGSSWSTSAPVSVRCNSVNVALSPIPSYTNLSSTFGGGAVGEAPFNFHATDCTPAHNASVAIGTFPSPVILRHYGPVLEVGSGAPVIVYARPTGTGTWTDHTSDFKFALSKRDVDITQKVTAILGFFPGYDYRIVPITDLNNSNALRCLDVLNKPAVRSYEYRFNITQ